MLQACRYQWDMARRVWFFSVVFSLLILTSSPRSAEQAHDGNPLMSATAGQDLGVFPGWAVTSSRNLTWLG